jgi:hypothetical protein
MSVKPLSFFFSVKDPEFTSYTTVVSDKLDNYVSHSFVRCPIYNYSGKMIGYKVSDDYIQQVAPNKYIVRLNNTYYIEEDGIGTISWQAVFSNDKPEIYYPVNVETASNIISTSDKYFGLKGTVSLFPKEDGSRYVNVILLH